MDEITFVFVL